MVREYWDTCLFIAYLKDSPDEREEVDIIDTLLRGARNGSRLIVVSTLVLAEIRRKSIYDEHH